ncbi:MAG: high-potential iron-sulfur protein [Salinisphaera sp.]|uniref:high-potential iron-sulfur protein n=1 Tax=Salinisphaera sp. TaxID=1914330 RepID=UPI003C7B5264
MKSKERKQSPDALSGASSRRDFLKQAGGMAAGVVAIPVWFASRQAQAHPAYGQTPKSALQYQDTPKGNQKCSNCSLYIPGSSANAMGHCKVVAGKVSPNGWCSAWAPTSN